jgi:hypothetical protein
MQFLLKCAEKIMIFLAKKVYTIKKNFMSAKGFTLLSFDPWK